MPRAHAQERAHLTRLEALPRASHLHGLPEDGQDAARRLADDAVRDAAPLAVAVRTAAERSGPLENQNAVLWRTLGLLSVTLQRQQFQVLVGCAPTLGDEVAGRLGNPLPEVPEFWRAAPDVAVAWGAEELDLPPSTSPR